MVSMEMAAAFVMAVNSVNHEAFSAGPHAPVVPHVERTPRAQTLRFALAKGLSKAARAIAPAEYAPAGGPSGGPERVTVAPCRG
jgi:hypothetical protein